MQTEMTKNLKNHGPSGPLYDLLIERLPTFTKQFGGHARLSVTELSKAMGVTTQSIYHVLPRGDTPARSHLSIGMARKLIEVSEKTGAPDKPKLTLIDLEPYLPSSSEWNYFPPS